MLRNELFRPWFVGEKDWGFEIIDGEFNGVALQIENLDFPDEGSSNISLDYNILNKRDLINNEYKNYEDKFDETDLQDEEENSEIIEFIGYRKDENIENNENNETAMDIVEEQESIIKEEEPSLKRAKYAGTIKKGGDKKKGKNVTIRRRAI